MKYSFWCKFCGETVLSDNKEDIARARKEHNPREFSMHSMFKNRGCYMLPIGKTGTKARPSLAKFLESQTAS